MRRTGREKGMNKGFGQRWQSLSIRKKISAFTGIIFFVCILSVIFDGWVVKFALIDFNRILEENAQSIRLVQALEEERTFFKNYVQNRRNVTPELFQAAVEHAQEAVYSISMDYEILGETRYVKIWAIRNSYEVYRKKRDVFLGQDRSDPSYINDLYTLYEMQDYLVQYAGELMDATLEAGNEVYRQKVPTLLVLPWVVLAFGSCLLYIMPHLSGLMKKSILSPVMKLVNASKKIADNDFFVEDVQVENQDEMGELVRAFNKMKYATGEYITALEERRKTLDLLHEEELKILETENRLETMKLDLLKSQVNPHFLFNTLNVIGGMANLEEAATTEKMIRALSSLFRYNLKTSDFEVPLARELKVVEDYMYLQQMRFGYRISYDIVCEADQEKAIVPAFTFQPLVENCIIHGLSCKEEGGMIRIRIFTKDDKLYIYIGDTGQGMRREELEELRIKLAKQKMQKSQEETHMGIICRRVFSMYPEGTVEIYSRHKEGTVIKLVIPQKVGGDHV